MRAEQPWSQDILEPLEILGVDRFAESAVVIRARINTHALRQWAAGREFSGRIKKGYRRSRNRDPLPPSHGLLGNGEGW